jgi:hypothetical protein
MNFPNGILRNAKYARGSFGSSGMERTLIKVLLELGYDIVVSRNAEQTFCLESYKIERV